MQRTLKAALRFTALAHLAVVSGIFSSTANAACVDPNTCYGTDALVGNTVGEHNISFGSGAVHRNAAGDGNTGIGANALYMNLTGDGNTAIGSQALYSNANGD